MTNPLFIRVWTGFYGQNFLFNIHKKTEKICKIFRYVQGLEIIV